MSQDQRSIWDSRYATLSTKVVAPSRSWLDRWVPIFSHIKPHALDIGCGLGIDTATLLDLGFQVNSIDFSAEAIKRSIQTNPEATHLNRDISEGLGTFPWDFSIVVANLSLHYFTKTYTFNLFQEIHTSLIKGGVFIFRLNSREDSHFGASQQVNQWTRVTINGVPKQFFDEEMVRNLLDGTFEIISLERMETNRYGKTKKLIECVAKKT